MFISLQVVHIKSECKRATLPKYKINHNHRLNKKDLYQVCFITIFLLWNKNK